MAVDDPGPRSAVVRARTALDALGAAVATLADVAREAPRWSEQERRDALTVLDRTVDALATVRASVLRAERDAGVWRRSGDPSFVAWRGRTAGTGRRTAAAQVRQADELGAVPSAAAAVMDGRITLEHAAIIGRTAASVRPDQRPAVLDGDAQEHLLSMAERLDAGTFGTALTRWAAALDPQSLERDHEAQRAARFLHVAQTPRGTFLKGRLDAMAGHRLTLALEALSPRPPADDDRDPGQRRADALDALASRILAHADTKPGGHVPPQVSMILTAETWLAARAERDRRRARAVRGQATGDRATLDVPTPRHADVGYPPATLEDGTPVPPSEVAVALCDCELTRIVVDADGVPLDLGRSERVFTGSQRRAVIARDRGCGWPQCDVPARWAEIHHIRWWERDTGPTSVDNGVLLCSYHHHEVHRRDLAITRLPAASDAGTPTTAGGRTTAHRPGTLASVRYEFRERTVTGDRRTADPVGGHADLPGPPPDPPAPSCSPGDRLALIPGPLPPGSASTCRSDDRSGDMLARSAR